MTDIRAWAVPNTGPPNGGRPPPPQAVRDPNFRYITLTGDPPFGGLAPPSGQYVPAPPAAAPAPEPAPTTYFQAPYQVYPHTQAWTTGFVTAPQPPPAPPAPPPTRYYNRPATPPPPAPLPSAGTYQYVQAYVPPPPHAPVQQPTALVYMPAYQGTSPWALPNPVYSINIRFWIDGFQPPRGEDSPNVRRPTIEFVQPSNMTIKGLLAWLSAPPYGHENSEHGLGIVKCKVIRTYGYSVFDDVVTGEKEAEAKQLNLEYEWGQEFWQTDAENKTLGELGWKGCVGLAAKVRPVTRTV